MNKSDPVSTRTQVPILKPVQEQIHKELMIERRFRQRDHLLAALLVFVMLFFFVTIFGLRRLDPHTSLPWFQSTAVLLAVALFCALVARIPTRIKGRLWVSAGLLFMPLIAAFSMHLSNSTPSSTLATSLTPGLMCMSVMLGFELLLATLLLVWLLPIMPVWQQNRWSYFFIPAGIIGIAGTLAVHLHCPATDNLHLGMHVAGAWLGTLLVAALARRFHRRWWQQVRREIQAEK